MDKQITPNNSRYIPFTQQPCCCAPTCIQMIMYKNNIPLIPIEKIGYYLGLIVPPSESQLFYNPRVSEIKPIAGYGTRIYMDEFEPNKAFKKLNIPLSLNVISISSFKNSKQVFDFLVESEKKNEDILFCFNHGALIDDPSRDWGHLVLFDRIIDNQFRIIDPSPSNPKWRLVKPEKMFLAMKKHGEKPTAAGLWKIKKI